MSLVHKERDDALNKYQQREREVQLCESQLQQVQDSLALVRVEVQQLKEDKQELEAALQHWQSKTHDCQADNQLARLNYDKLQAQF